jgi:acyl-coenzyme A thioesterase PaaI-like protein
MTGNVSTFFDYLGLTRQDHDNSPVVISMAVEEYHKDVAGAVSNGVYYSLLDVALGTAVTEQMNGFSATIDMHVQIFSHEMTNKLVCKGYFVQENGNIGSARGDVFDENNLLVATGLATFKVMKK